MCYLSREVCVVFARDGISHSAKGSYINYQYQQYTLNTEAGMQYHSGSGTEPLTTVSGPGGVAKLNVLETAKELNWSVTPADMLTPWTFSGDITVYVLDPQTREYVYDDTIPVSGSGEPGGSTGDNVSIAQFPTGLEYSAVLNGTATDIFGDTDVVLPGCQAKWYFSS
ncbi:hypothetical protein C7445_105103 [Alicyclobacillus sacchari]|uniref:Uncharacterized protein n=1 Tax=Alicyclobacillus sacchari TaxID=392010 RepID=A0A4R8LRC5_9BACL|nr:hypothetical protein C7445_105103 [Alicyclobacillus sacchari]GMA56031.1 hypothetical protein GCM10025858_05340 [Alicyclobacillus sacchari]